MSILYIAVIIVIALGVGIGLTLWSPFRRITEADDCFEAITNDGVTLPIWHFKAGDAHRHFPVILCHGLAANRFNMDLNPRISLARYLREQGYDVFVPELRGSDYGMKLNALSATKEFWHFNFDHHAHQDVPAIIAAVKERTKKDQVHWVGHSMGAMVIYAGAGRSVTQHLKSFVSLGGPARFTWAVGRTKWLARVGSTIRWAKAPLPLLGRSTAIGAGFLRLIIWRGPFNGRNMQARDLRDAFANLPNYVSTGLLKQTQQWMLTGLFCDSHGNDYVDDMQHATCPGFFVAGAADSVANVDSVKVGFDHWGNSDKRFYVLGRAEGHKFDYGHTDMTLGFRSPTEVYPLVAEWLNRHDEDLKGA